MFFGDIMKKGIRIQFCFALLCSLFVLISVFAQSSGDVRIGKQVWMSKNLDVSTYRTGAKIRHARSDSEWRDAGSKGEGAWCYYDFDPKNGEFYGKLYNWYAVNDARGLAPKGYHIPSDAEWTVLINFLGGESVAGYQMKSTRGWYNGGNGDNSSGFNCLPSGKCTGGGSFDNLTMWAYFWSSSEYKEFAWGRDLGYNNSNYSEISRGNYYRSLGMSVRCLRD